MSDCTGVFVELVDGKPPQLVENSTDKFVDLCEFREARELHAIAALINPMGLESIRDALRSFREKEVHREPVRIFHNTSAQP